MHTQRLVSIVHSQAALLMDAAVRVCCLPLRSCLGSHCSPPCSLLVRSHSFQTLLVGRAHPRPHVLLLLHAVLLLVRGASSAAVAPHLVGSDAESSSSAASSPQSVLAALLAIQYAVKTAAR